MKFLTISTFKDTRSALQPEELNKLNLADAEYIVSMKKKMGDKWTMYSVVGWNKHISIGEYDSVEEYAQTLQGPSAQAGFSNYEGYALTEIDWKSAEDFLKQAKST